MALTIPASVGTNGTMLVLFVPTMANYRAPKLTELTAGTVIDLSCYLTGDGLGTDTTENNVEDPRLCSKEVYEQPGDSTNTLELTYVYNPEEPVDDEARLGLPRGTKGYIVIRWAIDTETALAVGQEVDVYPVTLGKQRKQPAARNGVHRIMQKPFVTGALAEDVAIAA